MEKVVGLPSLKPGREDHVALQIVGARLAARLPDRQVAEVHVRCAVLNTFNNLGMPVTVAHV